METRGKATFRDVVGDWLLEASVLLAVFPVIDQMLVAGAFSWAIVLAAYLVVVLLFVVGLYFKVR